MSVRLLLALHFHQPVGNFDSVFRDAVRLCYAPILDHFERHPGVGAAFHFSGCLLEWLERNDRPFLDRLFALVGSGRIEPLGGGFYEPILTAIPRADALDQIERLASYWQRHAGIRPRGAWIAERVWEPGLADLLAEADVDYTILDDQHLRFAGLVDERFSGLWVTERCGRRVAFFPSDFRLRYLIPFRTLDQVRDHFLALAGGGGDMVLTYGDDAEKFGFWPRTHEWVIEGGWLERFFVFLEQADGPVRSGSPGAYLATRPPARKVYIPSSSYPEMLEWALPPEAVALYGRARSAALRDAPEEAVRAFVRGGLWDMFLSRYPESDHLHKHVLWTSRRARALPPGSGGREAAITAALRAQCNCAYWHGLFGGIYFPHLRHGAYESILEADSLLAAGGAVPTVELADIDGDLEDEVILRAGGTQAFFRPGDAGTLAELDFLPSRFNVTNVMARWREGYHEGRDLTHAPAPGVGPASPHETQVGIRPEDLEARAFDDLPLRSLRDFRSAAAPEPRGLVRFAGMERLRGRLEGAAVTPAGFLGRCRLGGFRYEREVRIDPSGSLTVSWDLPRAEIDEGWFGTVLCLSLLAAGGPGRRLIVESGDGGILERAPGDSVKVDAAARVTLEDDHFRFALDLHPRPSARVVTAPVETLQRSEDRYDVVYQGTLVALCWKRERGAQGRPSLVISFRRTAGEDGS